MSIPNAPVNVGDVLAGRYRTVRLLGVGAMGVVVEATHIHLDQRVALKFLLAHQATHRELHERFLREARAASKLRSQHVTRVSDFGTLDSGAPFLVMELLDGKDLAAVIEARGRLPVPEAVEYVLQMLEAVGEAHRSGIVHRDLKPANLFLTADASGPCVKVLDFGVSKLTQERGNLKLTSEGAAIGSPLYMSPEQVQGLPGVDERSDIWACGVILYELVTGTLPFIAETMMALTTAILLRSPEPFAKVLPDAPPGLEAVILRCLAKQPGERFADVAALAAALAPFAPPRAAGYVERVARMRGVTVGPSPSPPVDVSSAPQPVVSAPARTMAATTNGATSQVATPLPKKGSGPWVAVLAAVTLAAVVGGVAFVKLRGAPAQSASAVEPQPQPSPEADAGIRMVVSVEPPVTASATTAASTTAAASAKTAASAAVAPARLGPKNDVPKATPAAPEQPAPTVVPKKPKSVYDD
jgi:serine/threonine-protein kinase